MIFEGDENVATTTDEGDCTGQNGEEERLFVSVAGELDLNAPGIAKGTITVCSSLAEWNVGAVVGCVLAWTATAEGGVSMPASRLSIKAVV